MIGISTFINIYILVYCRFVEELHQFDQTDLDESILNEMETRVHTRAVFGVPSLQQQRAANAPTRPPETRSAKRARTQREPSPKPAPAAPADEQKEEQEDEDEEKEKDEQQVAAPPGTAEPQQQSEEPTTEPPAKEDGAGADDAPANKNPPEDSTAANSASLDASMDAYMADKLLGKRSLLVLVRWIHGVVRCAPAAPLV